ncbi:MAG: hypothetical protein Q3Y08_03585 [Butyricicoccus sp.]|nr:hypothetical protein [Butyricicoccus sp.]
MGVCRPKSLSHSQLPKAFPNTTEMLSNEEIRRLLQSTGFSLFGGAVHLAFVGSLRKGEILALTWNDVNFKSGTIVVNKTLKRVRKDAMQAWMGHPKFRFHELEAIFSRASFTIDT